jgi:hypothetical protein
MSVERAEAILGNAADPEPSTLELVWPTLSPEAMYGLAGEIVATIAPHSEADPAAVLVSLLASFGALVGPGPHARADGAEHPARIWGLIVGDTAKARKGSSWMQCRRVLAGADKSFADERVLSGFGSGEALVDAVAGDNDRRLLVVETEYARVLAASNRDGSTLSTLSRQAWDGGRLQVRSRSGTAVADGAHVVVLGHITKTELQAKLAESDAFAGSLNRFLIVPARRSKLLPSGGSLSDFELSDFVRRFALFAVQAQMVSTIWRTAEAEAYWAEVYTRLADDDPGGLLGAVIARDAAQVLRLSVTFALLDGMNRITVAHIRAAEAVWNYARAGAALIFGTRTGDPIADQILAALQDSHGVVLDGAAIHRLFDGHVKGDRINQALELLEKQGLANKENKATKGRPRLVVSLANKASEAKEVAEPVSGAVPHGEEDQSDEPDEKTLAQWAAEAKELESVSEEPF